MHGHAAVHLTHIHPLRSCRPCAPVAAYTYKISFDEWSSNLKDEVQSNLGASSLDDCFVVRLDDADGALSWQSFVGFGYFLCYFVFAQEPDPNPRMGGVFEGTPR